MSQSMHAPESGRGSLFFSVWVLFVLIVALPPLWLLLAFGPSGEHRADRLVRTWARRVVRWSGCCGLPRHACIATELRDPAARALSECLAAHA